MSQIIEQQSVACGRIRRRSTTTGTPPEALATTSSPSPVGWKTVVDALLHWRNHAAEVLDPDDLPTPEAIESAIDFAIDQSESNNPIPQSITPTGGGCITLQWLDGPRVVTIEILGTGTAELTEFSRGKLKNQCRVLRDPLTRRLQLHG